MFSGKVWYSNVNFGGSDEDAIYVQGDAFDSAAGELHHRPARWLQLRRLLAMPVVPSTWTTRQASATPWAISTCP